MEIDYLQYQTDFKSRILELLKKHSVFTGDFTLSSGKKSNIFVDCKRTLLLSEGHQYVGSYIYNRMRVEHPEVHKVAGVELGGCPISSAVASVGPTPIDALYVRKEQKYHGSERLVEGVYHTGDKVVLVEDVITTGASTIKALDLLKICLLKTVAVISVVDRSQGGKEAIEAAHGIPVHSLFTIEDLK